LVTDTFCVLISVICFGTLSAYRSRQIALLVVLELLHTMGTHMRSLC